VNNWFKDPRVEAAELNAFEAGRAESRGDLTEARELYRKAAKGFAAVGLEVPVSYTNTRRDLAVAAATSLSRANNLGSAVPNGSS
jgi:hypothetical protein